MPIDAEDKKNDQSFDQNDQKKKLFDVLKNFTTKFTVFFTL